MERWLKEELINRHGHLPDWPLTNGAILRSWLSVNGKTINQVAEDTGLSLDLLKTMLIKPVVLTGDQEERFQKYGINMNQAYETYLVAPR